MWHKNIAGRFFGLVTKHACDGRTDGCTDRQNYDSQDRASIAASRGKNRQALSVNELDCRFLHAATQHTTEEPIIHVVKFS